MSTNETSHEELRAFMTGQAYMRELPEDLKDLPPEPLPAAETAVSGAVQPQEQGAGGDLHLCVGDDDPPLLETPSALEFAVDYIRRGWAPIRVPYRAKGVPYPGWKEVRLTEATVHDHFGNRDQNVGVLLGEPSGDLTDIDLDCWEALVLAPVFLPPTLTFGRESKRRSHFLFKAKGAKTKKLSSPAKTKAKTLVEIRSTGVQTVFPGSVHMVGEPIDFDGGEEPFEIDADDLYARVRKLAAACLLMRAGLSKDDACAVAQGTLELPDKLADEVRARIEQWLDLATQEIQETEDEEEAPAVAPSTDFRTAANNYNAGHPRTYPMPGRGTCPACGHHDCFGRLADNERRWSCFSASHEECHVGLEGEGCWHGDALDLDAHESGCTRADMLRQLGYLTSASAVVVSPASSSLRPVQIIVTTDEHAVIEEAVNALANDPTVYQRGGSLTYVIREVNPPPKSVFPEGMPRLAIVPGPHLRERLTVVGDWYREVHTEKGRKQLVPIHVPKWAAPAVAARGNWAGIRHLFALVETPVLRPDGTVLDQPGYDLDTGLLYVPRGNFPRVSQEPTLADAQQALAELREVVCDFPFETPAHEAAWLAALLTALARFAFDGPSPLILIDANVRGSGKTLLCDIIAVIVLGHPMALMAMEESEEEMRKQITTHAVAGSRLVLIDNVANALGGPSLDKALTRVRWSDRILGGNTLADLPLLVTWFANGNNVALKGDMGRRVLHVRLRSEEEHPEQRASFKHPRLMEWVRQNRERLVVAALTLMRAYFVAGCPKATLQSWGSFEGWTDVIRQALVWAGMRDPAETREQLLESADLETSALHDLLEGLHDLSNGKGYTASQILTVLEGMTGFDRLRGAIQELVPVTQGKVTSGRLGKKLQYLRERSVGGKMLVNVGEKGGAKLWTVMDVSGKPEAPVAAPTQDSRPAPVPEDNCDFST